MYRRIPFRISKITAREPLTLNLEPYPQLAPRPPVAAALTLLKCGSYSWLPSRDPTSFSACQIGPSVSYWLQWCYPGTMDTTKSVAVALPATRDRLNSVLMKYAKAISVAATSQ
jgi:hypothetical protein